MDRKIKFKYMVKRENGYCFSQIFTIQEIENGTANIWLKMNQVSEDELRRFIDTTILDKNSKDLLDWWEGDILKHKDTIYIIVWHNGGLYAKSTELHCIYPVGETLTWMELPVKIGTVYENPELLEKDK